jgi:hypothetical protein
MTWREKPVRQRPLCVETEGTLNRVQLLGFVAGEPPRSFGHGHVELPSQYRSADWGAPWHAQSLAGYIPFELSHAEEACSINAYQVSA